jgi:hypothetical protein
MDDKLIEAVARVMCAADGLDPDQDRRVIGSVMLDVAVNPETAQRWRLYVKRACAALRAIEDAGYVVVPKEPTEEMATVLICYVGDRTDATDFYQELLSARPRLTGEPQ